MSHCIDIILIKKSELRNIVIDTLLDDTLLENKIEWETKYKELPQNMLAFPNLECREVSDKFGPGIKFIRITTDYFGGFGDQSATTLISTKKGYKNFYKGENTTNSINTELIKYGVIRGTSDEFDSIDLGKYRSNNDFLDI